MMNDDELKKRLQNNQAPQPDANARKRAVNLAMAAYEERQKAKKKKTENIFQGFPFLSRLTGKSNTDERNETMEMKSRKRLMYGSMATAVALALFAAPVILTGLQDNFGETDSSAELLNAEISKDSKNVGATTNVASLNDQPLERWRRMQEQKIRSEERNVSPPPVAKPSAAPEMAEDTLAMGRAASIDQSFMASQTLAPAQEETEADKSSLITSDMPSQYYQETGRDQFEDFDVNPFKQVGEEPVSTFSADVDTASYSFVRRQLNNGVLPQKDAVRIEEMVNYFDYDYPLPDSREQPFKPSVTVMDSPWTEGRKVLHIGIKGFDIEEKPKSNLVFLLDVSGSMNSPDKLPLLVNSLKMLVDNMGEEDTVSIVVYAGAAGTVLEPTSASEKTKIYNALDSLSAGGSTAGAQGINLAYQLAEQNFEEDAVNRVILATDGDFNVGITDRDELQDFVERKRESGVFLSVLGFGQGNYNDHMMQTLAQNGNGVAAYIDTLGEARKLLVEEASSTLFPIAKDVKFQVEFNPDMVSEYRLIGYETRALKREDFNNDKVDAGDIGAGHSVTAIYEFTPVGSDAASIDELRYSSDSEKAQAPKTDIGEYAYVKTRYKLPDEEKSKLLTLPVTLADEVGTWHEAGNDAAFSLAVASFAQKLKGGKYTGDLSYDDIIAMAQQSKGEDPYGYRTEFIQLVRMAKNAAEM
jgi:Ca-activated chloride channel family protein